MAPSDYSITTASTSTSTAWTYWNVQYTSGTNTTTADYTWAAWIDGTATTSASSSTSAWIKWNVNYTGEDGNEGYVVRVEQPTPEELARQAEEHRRREEELKRQAAEQARLAQEAEDRAAELLRLTLSPEQLAEFEKDRAFTVISKDGERKYRIKKGWSHNVERIDDAGKRLHTLCAHPETPVPHFDNMLAQKLMLEHDEQRFLKIANKGQAA